jgi:hypothetical protein
MACCVFIPLCIRLVYLHRIQPYVLHLVFLVTPVRVKCQGAMSVLFALSVVMRPYVVACLCSKLVCLWPTVTSVAGVGLPCADLHSLCCYDWL